MDTNLLFLSIALVDLKSYVLGIGKVLLFACFTV